MSMKSILAVDDDNINLRLIDKILGQDFNIVLASSGMEALNKLETQIPELILMDIEMPEMNGIDTVKLIKNNPLWNKIPVIFLTAESNPKTEAECLALGADDFILKPLVPMVMKKRINHVIELYNLRYHLEEELSKKTRELEILTLNSIMSISNTIDAKDKYTSGHSKRVAQCSVDLAKKLGWDEAELSNLQYVALLHDIGKIGIPDSVLNKPDRLTDEEFDIIKTHPQTGAEILKDIHMLPHVQEGALFHHEKYNGRGYPFGISGEDIPIYARIISIADSYDAMTTNRVYRKRLSTQDVIEEFEKGKGTQFDPNLAEIFIEMLKGGYTVEV